MRYSNDLRIKVAKMFDKGMKRRDIATTLQINLSTLSQWKQQHKEDKLLVIKEYKRGFKSRFDKQAIQKYVEANPDKYLREIKEVFTISKTRLALILNELGLTLKKRKHSTKKEMRQLEQSLSNTDKS
jgi:transposase